MPGVSINLRILKEADLITEKKEGKNRLYSLNRKTTSELVRFFDDMYDYKLKLLKEYVENKERQRKTIYWQEMILTGSSRNLHFCVFICVGPES